MKTAFELIEANGLTLHGDIEHFAEVVRADERRSIKDKADTGIRLVTPMMEFKREKLEQEPVAWMVYTRDGESVYVTDNPTDIQEGQRALPLYTSSNEDYMELIMAVENKYPGESRHNTALRYIRDREGHKIGAAKEEKIGVCDE